MMVTDSLIIEFDRVVRTLAGAHRSTRPYPGESIPEADLEVESKQVSQGCMRVNHAGEVCAQALYQGQALAGESPEIKRRLMGAAIEELEHLAWTQRRIQELNTHASFLSPIWYVGSLGIGLFAGMLGDRWSLAFLEETERQVAAHLAGHLDVLPRDDLRSRAVVAQMRIDEIGHADMAEGLGAHPIPVIARQFMKMAAKVMTFTAYRV